MRARSRLIGIAAVAVAAVAGLVLAIAACGGGRADEDCDREDLANRESECGYYGPDGAFVLYPWVVPGVGGHPPAGKHPAPPRVIKPTSGVKPKPAATRKPAGRQ